MDVQVEPDGEETRAFTWGQDGSLATRDDVHADAAIAVEVVADGRLELSAVEKHTPDDWLGIHWKSLQPRLGVAEVVARQRFWLLDLPSIEILYSTGRGEPGAISLEGYRMLAPPVSEDRIFRRRASTLAAWKWVLAAVACGVAAVALSLGLPRAQLALSVGGSVIGSLAVYGAVLTATMGRRVALLWGGIGAAGLSMALWGIFESQAFLE
jgi:hypothetical protein